MPRLNFNTIQIRNMLILGVVLPGAAMAYTFTFGQSEEEKEKELQIKFKDEISRKQRIHQHQSNNSADSKIDSGKDIDKMYDFLRKEVTNKDADFVNPILHKGRGNMVRIEKMDEKDNKTADSEQLEKKVGKIEENYSQSKPKYEITRENKDEPKKGWYPGKYIQEFLKKK